MKYFKITFIVLLALAALGLLVFGPSTEAHVPRGFVVVDYWEKWSGEPEELMRQTIDQFNRTVGAEKHIYVNYISTSSVEQKTLVACAAGNPPDIAGLWGRCLNQYAEVDALEPLEDLMRARGITQETYKPACWDACTYKGHLYGIVSSPASVALIYNKKIFRENASSLRAAGLDPDRAPLTLQELDAYAQVLTKFDEKGHMIQAGYLPMEPGWYIDQTPFWFGAKIWDEQSERFTLTDPGVINAFEWIQSYSIRYGKEALTNFQSGMGIYGSPQNSFLVGKVAMEIQGPWMADLILRTKPSISTLKWSTEEELKKPLAQRLENYDWGVVPFPSAVPGLKNVTYCNIDVLSIPRRAQHKAEAIEFLVYLSRQDVMENLSSVNTVNTPLAKVSDEFIRQHRNPYISIFEDLMNSPNACIDPKVPIVAEVYAELDNIAQRVALMETKPAEALAEAQVRLQARYDAYVALQKARGR